ncbi:MAG TPA: hypothetical protein VK590_02580 [Saprospiraceae bacterium]|nr:hypothetical protein [Saprospiraceae bacterium]
MHTKKKIYAKDKKNALKSINGAIKCLKDIPAIQCTENANRKIDEALSYCYMVKDNV